MLQILRRPVANVPTIVIYITDELKSWCYNEKQFPSGPGNPGERGRKPS
jgi:hypothetical protein